MARRYSAPPSPLASSAPPRRKRNRLAPTWLWTSGWAKAQAARVARSERDRGSPPRLSRRGTEAARTAPTHPRKSRKAGKTLDLMVAPFRTIFPVLDSTRKPKDCAHPTPPASRRTRGGGRRRGTKGDLLRPRRRGGTGPSSGNLPGLRTLKLRAADESRPRVHDRVE